MKNELIKSLQEAIQLRINPHGCRLSNEAEQRLRKTIEHFSQQVQGLKDPKTEILRESYASLIAWIRKNPHALIYSASVTQFISTPLASLPTSLENENEDGINAFPISQQKDILIKQENVVKYCETEYNVVLNSKDRNWVLNRSENRYNFSVQLNSGATPQGTSYQATLLNRLKNIVRIEFIKAILPVEGLEVVSARTCDASGESTPDPESVFISTLSFPFIHILMNEHIGNNIGTHDLIDRSLAICQYDSVWKSDQHSHSSPTRNRGFTMFTPKALTAQRSFALTPLASLNHLEFQILSSEGVPISCEPDSFKIEHILDSTHADVSGTCYYTPTDSQYLFIQLSDFFPLWTFSKHDRITFAGLSANATGFDAMARWLSRVEGHIVIAIAHTDSSGTIQLNHNDCGYANWILIQNRRVNPVISGSCEHLPFTPDESELHAISVTDGAVLNLSRQVQLFLRVITREMDPRSTVRPDNI